MFEPKIAAAAFTLETGARFAPAKAGPASPDG